MASEKKHIILNGCLLGTIESVFGMSEDVIDLEHDWVCNVGPESEYFYKLIGFNYYETNAWLLWIDNDGDNYYFLDTDEEGKEIDGILVVEPKKFDGDFKDYINKLMEE